MPALEQSCANAIAKGQARSVTGTFTKTTTAGSALVVSATCAGGISAAYTITSDAGATFTKIGDRSLGDLQVLVWLAQNAPATTTITVTGDADRSIQLRGMEYSGVHQSNALDKISVGLGNSDQPYTGASGTTSQADSVAVAIVGSQYASTTQAGFYGGLTRLFESVSPSSYGWVSNADWERSRCTVHHAISSVAASFYLYGLLSSYRNWIAFIVCLRGQSTGPVKLSSTKTRQQMGIAGKGTLTVFGPLRAGLVASASRLMSTSAIGTQARIGPFNWQYRLGGWSGLLIGDGTPYQVESFDGLEGWALRTSDDALPRGDGSLRGIDLEASRQILFELKVGTDLGGPNGALAQQTDVETAMDTLYRALVPQRDGDWELIWRHPGRPLRMVRVRPTNLVRDLDYKQTVVQLQKFTLVAADPRHYSAFQLESKITPVPVTGTIVPKAVINQGNGMAYPNIRISGTQAVSRIELVNASYDLSFVVQAQVPATSTLIGDMEARATGAARSVVTIDGQSKYGAWQHPRDTFALGPGQNDVYLNTTPAGAAVTCTLTYRDTYQG